MSIRKMSRLALFFCICATWMFPALLFSAEAPHVRLAVLRDSLPGVDPLLADNISAALKRNNFEVTQITIDQLGSRDSFNASLFDCLVLTHAHNFPSAARDNFFAFVRSGGDLVLAGGSGFLTDFFQGRGLVLPAFSKYEPYRLQDIRSVVPYPDQDIFKGKIRINGRFAGISAVGFSRMSAKFVPLLSAVDNYQRTKGWAAGLLIDFEEYKGSNWLLLGINSPAFYRTPGFSQFLGAVVPQLVDDRLTRLAAAEHEERLATRIKLKTPAPKGFIHLSSDGKHLLYPDGKRFFMIGANYHRSLHTGEWRRDFEDPAFEDDFRKARDSGVNCIRLGPAERFYEDPEIVKECARRYGVYLLIILNWGTRQDFVENAERVARMYADEPMVLGYDIQNEPFAEEVASLTFDGRNSPALASAILDRYAAETRPPAASRLGSRPSRLSEAGRRRLATYAQLWGRATEHLTRGSGSTFPGLIDKFWVPEQWKEVAQVTDGTFDLWIRKHIEAIRKYDKNHLITVGHNKILQGLPANRQLDFVSHHVYDWPLSYEQVMTNVTGMDRLAKLWPDKPITLGEFGYSNGVPMPDGHYLDFYTSAVGEMMHYLYALSKGYDGCMKWVVTDWHWDVIGKAGPPSGTRLSQIYEAYFGMYSYDGNPHGLGRPKPIAYAMKFLRDYIDRNGAGGTVDIRPGRTSIGAVYRYKGANALFVGDCEFKSPELEFSSTQPANVMLTWGPSGIKLMSTADARLSIAPAKLVPGIAAQTAKPTGKLGSVKSQGERLEMYVLEGELITIR